MIDYDKLRAHAFAPVIQTYTTRDTLLYALGLNIGVDPLDADALRFVADDPPQVAVTMPMNLARLGPWMRDPAVGIDYSRIVVGEFTLRLHAPIPASGTVRGEHRILRVTDKGAGRGALVTVLRELRDDATNVLLAEYEQVTFCRGDGGFAVDGRHDAPRPLPPMPAMDRPPDLVIALLTSPRQALIYRLSGDMNPLHSHPEVARAAGFERPILHGLSTMGMTGHALARAMSRSEGLALAQLSARFAAPVFPGDVLGLEGWREGERLAFRVTNATRREVVSNGSASFRHAPAPRDFGS